MSRRVKKYSTDIRHAYTYDDNAPGYCSLRDGGNASVAFHYYNTDHLGSNREVVAADGTVEQITNYYPFGAPFADPETVVDADLQPYKYNGKELDRMHGLDTYDYKRTRKKQTYSRYIFRRFTTKREWQLSYQ